MKTVTIDDVIGYDWWTGSGITSDVVKKQLDGLLDGEDIQVDINSPGGSVYEGAVIFNLLRDHAKTHNVSVRVNSIAMSAASYIALAARTVNKNAIINVSDNSVFMIHNPWTYSVGDYRVLAKDSEYVEKLAAMFGLVYSVVSGQTEKSIRKTMDDETYFVGKEIVDAGFANDFDTIAGDGSASASASGIAANTRDNLIINAKFAANKAIERTRAAMEKDSKAYRGDLEKAVAFYQIKPPTAASAGGEITTSGGGIMKPEELLAQHKACYDAVFALGEKAALDKERARVSAHIMLGKEAGSLETAVKYIESGESSMDEKIRAEYLALSMKKNRLDARNADEPGDINTGTESEADAKSIAEAFRAGAQGKTIGGKK
jgi:ATP-dependent protease ClpP protease subunit